MEPHDLNSYRMQWPASSHDEVISEEVYEDQGDDDVIEEEYLVGEEIIPTNEINAISNTLDQSAAQNLIYMAQEGNMAMGDLIEEQVEQAENGDYNDQEYFECQVTTEEVITDDWVQRQGEERIEIIIDSIESGQAQESVANNADDEIDVSLPTIQDEYTASRPYPCDFCSRRFRKKANLINHMVAHQQERPHVCHLCGARYIRKSDLMQHLKIHAYIPDDHIDQEERPSVRSSGGSKRSHKQMSGSSSSSATGLGRGGLGKSKPPAFERMVQDDVQLLCDVANQSKINHQEEMVKFPIIDDKRPFVCQECGLAFTREKALLSHSKSHIVLDAHLECEQCGEMFFDAALLREHEYTHANIIEYEDDQQGQYQASSSSHHYNQQHQDTEEDFDDEDNDGTYEPVTKREHMDDDDEDEDFEVGGGKEEFGIFYCDHCGMSFHRVNLLRQHVKTHLRQLSGDEQHEVQCQECGETFAEALDLLAHAEVHARHACVKCLLCGEECKDEDRLETHVQSKHKQQLNALTCGVCGKQCRDAKSLQKHSWEHSRVLKKAACPICRKMFQNKARLKRHLISHRKRTVQCDLCMEEFPDGRSLMNHRHSHSNDITKKFPCKECGKSFGSRSSQQIHVRMHTGERPYGCRFCWKSFADGGTLRKHERIHTGEKPYGCVVCPRAFNQRVVLREHIRSHHSAADPTRAGSNAPFYCQVCHNSYYNTDDLIADLIAHCDENTKRQRPIQIGPRKYKRRRKLKPHELKMITGTEGNMTYNMDVCSEEDENNLVDSDACTEDAKPERSSRQPARSTSGGKRRPVEDHYYQEAEHEEYVPGMEMASNDNHMQQQQEDQQDQQEGDDDDEQEEINVSQQQQHLSDHVYRNPAPSTSGRTPAKPRSTNNSAATAMPSSSAQSRPGTDLMTSSGRPKMIHTEKSRTGDGKKKTVTRSTPRVITTTSTLTAAGNTSSARRNPRRNMEESLVVDKDGGQGLTMSSTELADVLGNKKTSDKYSVDIVNDLESILCSPIRPRVSESSTGPEYSQSMMMMMDDDVVVDDSERQQVKKPGRTIIECRRTYLPSAGEDRSKKVGAPGQSRPAYTAKISSAAVAGNSGSGGQYGIVRINNNSDSRNVNLQNNRAKVTAINNQLLQRTNNSGNSKVVSKVAIKESYSTTEDEGETLDDLLNREEVDSGQHQGLVEFIDVGGLPGPRSKKTVVKTEFHKCQMCNIVMEDKYELMEHAKTHF